MSGQKSPLYGSIVIMACIVTGIVLYLLTDWFQGLRVKSRAKKIEITDMTDLELKPIDQQDISYDDAHSLFSSARTMLSKPQHVTTSSINYGMESTFMGEKESFGQIKMKPASNFLKPNAKQNDLLILA